MDEFNAKVASHSTAIAKAFNAEIARVGCQGADHTLISTSLAAGAASCPFATGCSGGFLDMMLK